MLELYVCFLWIINISYIFSFTRNIRWLSWTTVWQYDLLSEISYFLDTLIFFIEIHFILIILQRWIEKIQQDLASILSMLVFINNFGIFNISDCSNSTSTARHTTDRISKLYLNSFSLQLRLSVKNDDANSQLIISTSTNKKRSFQLSYPKYGTT